VVRVIGLSLCAGEAAASRDLPGGSGGFEPPQPNEGTRLFGHPAVRLGSRVSFLS
jgi:hypothetical protein